MISYLISVAIEHHVHNITLEVRVSNNVAIKLYKKWDFMKLPFENSIMAMRMVYLWKKR